MRNQVICMLSMSIGGLLLLSVFGCTQSPASVTGTLTATTIVTVVPTLTPTMEATLTPTTETITSETPIAESVKLNELGNRLFSLTSFAFDFESTLTKPSLHYRGKRVNTPSSWFIRGEGATPGLAYISIGKRQWANFFDQLPVSCPDASTASICEAAIAMNAVIQTTFGYVFQDQEAVLIPGIVSVDNSNSYKYYWQDSDGNDQYLYVLADNGTPIKYEGDGITLKFSEFNSPTNTITSPTSEMPQKLHLDDARMALNSLASFRYTSTEDIGNTTSSATTEIEGVYVQANQAWSAKWSLSSELAINFLTVGTDTWASMDNGTTWLPKELYAIMDDSINEIVDSAAPFHFWPDSVIFQNGILQSATTSTVSGTECHEYLFIPVDTSVDIEIRLCVTPDEAIPLRFDLSAYNEGVIMHIVREISHMDDPTNVVEPP